MSGWLTIPYPMTAAVEESQREAQMDVALRQGLLKLVPQPIDETASLSIACYGPSLHDTWRDLQRPILSVSGAHNFLITRGVIPDFHADMDPRRHKVVHILRPHKDVQYLMASVCHPFTWAVLKGYRVKLFHVVSGNNTYYWLHRRDPQGYLVAAGSSIGLGAMHLGGILGYRHFEIHGMDGSYATDGARHAGRHFGHTQDRIEVTADGRTWTTSRIMHNSNVELFNLLAHWPLFVVLHGDGLVQAMMREYDPPNGAVTGTMKADAIRSAVVEFVTRKAG